jgi:acetyl esterase/lipase
MPSIRAQLLSRYLRLTVKPKPLHLVDPAELRRWYESKAIPLRSRGVAFETVADGKIKGEWSRPLSGAKRTILYLHGGGYVFGSPRVYRTLTSALALSAEADVFAPVYRLAPEAPCPAAIEDATAAYEWLLKQGVSPSTIVIAGDSAGGGLTLTSLMALRDRRRALPAAAIVYSPWTDLAATGASAKANAVNDCTFKEETVREGASRYRGALDAKDPRVSPLYGDFSGLPPLLIFVSKSEILYDDATRAAERAKAAGVDVRLEAQAGLPHVWPLFQALIPEGREAVALSAAFVKERTGAAAKEKAA